MLAHLPRLGRTARFRNRHTPVHYDRPVGRQQGGASYGAPSFRSSLLQSSVVDSLTSVLLDGKTSHRRRRYCPGFRLIPCQVERIGSRQVRLEACGHDSPSVAHTRHQRPRWCTAKSIGRCPVCHRGRVGPSRIAHPHEVVRVRCTGYENKVCLCPGYSLPLEDRRGIRCGAIRWTRQRDRG